MRRSPAFDPPEYQDWSPDPSLVAAYRARIEGNPQRQALVQELDRDQRLGLYRHLLRTRLVDIGLKRWVRQGVISKAWLGTGEEAVTVGAVAALHRDRDVVSPMIRNAGACPMMGMPIPSVFRGYLATSDAPNGGRDLHIGDPARGVIQPISHMGTNVPVMAGVALAARIKGQESVALTWIGDGATKSGECHEGLAFAAHQRLPAIFVLQNNQVALGTRASAHGAGSLEAWPQLYGMAALHADGNHVLDVYAATRLAADRCRRGEGPAMVVAETFRMGGHATHDEREARETFPAELFESWGKRDPVGLFECWLEEEGFGPEELSAVENDVRSEVEAAAEEALASKGNSPDPATVLYEGISLGGPLVGVAGRPVNVLQILDKVRHS
jgi:2-oxoisovalerate dehydrogenase E1 component